LADRRTKNSNTPGLSRSKVVKVPTQERFLVRVRGIVQGVGFRPFIYQLAVKYHLRGWVNNTSEGVCIDIEGLPVYIRAFLKDLKKDSPPRSVIEDITLTPLAPDNLNAPGGFTIRPSITEMGKYQLVSPDIATCPDCFREILTPEDRRYAYPFTNCTNCGPRFTIIEDIPYDRTSTTMKHFQMCPDCQREYEDPMNRRFHAQPNVCPVCGPSLGLLDASGRVISTVDTINMTASLLKKGGIIAIKGLGGFLLACDATNGQAVNTLRDRKKRLSKPFAVMVASIEEVRKYCTINDIETELLESPAGPIVLLPWRKTGQDRPPDTMVIVEAVAPELNYLGVMLPYTPLHHLLLREVDRPLVMTSGNLSEEPIAKDNDEAVSRLSGIADYFLLHNRDIYARYDDSVTIVERNVPQIIRRARGYAPFPIRLNFQSRPTLACGAEEKNTFCLTRDDYAFVSQHIGDMENIETLECFTNTISLYKRLFRIEPQIIAHDLHPNYLSTKYARELAQVSDIKLVPVQHHYAHIVSGMVDNAIDTPVIGVAFDGTGYGNDGHIWGGEFMTADYHGFKRLGHIEYLPLPGGVQAIKKPYRTAAGYLLRLLGEDALKGLPFLKTVSDIELDIIKRQITTGLNSPLNSSCGRLFDAVSALTGIRGEINYEAQAAIELEMAAYDEHRETGCYQFAVVEKGGMIEILVSDLLTAMIGDIRKGVNRSVISARFHNTIAQMIQNVCHDIAAETGIQQVVLSGGVFQNRLLLRKAVELLEGLELVVYTHRQVPTNDGGISLGQAIVANFI
jgi:hydrogenase maturation protein HypF